MAPVVRRAPAAALMAPVVRRAPATVLALGAVCAPVARRLPVVLRAPVPETARCPGGIECGVGRGRPDSACRPHGARGPRPGRPPGFRWSTSQGGSCSVGCGARPCGVGQEPGLPAGRRRGRTFRRRHRQRGCAPVGWTRQEVVQRRPIAGSAHSGGGRSRAACRSAVRQRVCPLGPRPRRRLGPARGGSGRTGACCRRAPQIDGGGPTGRPRPGGYWLSEERPWLAMRSSGLGRGETGFFIILETYAAPWRSPHLART